MIWWLNSKKTKKQSSSQAENLACCLSKWLKGLDLKSAEFPTKSYKGGDSSWLLQMIFIKVLHPPQRISSTQNKGHSLTGIASCVAGCQSRLMIMSDNSFFIGWLGRIGLVRNFLVVVKWCIARSISIGISDSVFLFFFAFFYILGITCDSKQKMTRAEEQSVGAFLFNMQVYKWMRCVVYVCVHPCACMCVCVCTSARVGGFETRGLAVHHSAPLAETILSAGSLFSIPSCCTLMCFGLTTNWHPPSHLTLIKLLKDFHWTFDYLAFSIPYHFFFFFHSNVILRCRDYICSGEEPVGIWGKKKKKKVLWFPWGPDSSTS